MNMFTKKLNWLIMSMMLMISGSAWAGEVTDVITAADLAATSTNYTEFKNVSFVSDAIYAGQSAKTSSGGIQLRSKNSNSGIVTTTSGGKIKSVTITYESGSNTVDVYGSNTAYTSAADLYGSSKGTKVGSLTETGTIDFSGAGVDFSYIGIRSYNGALYLSSIEITWETDGGETVTVTAPSFSPAGGEYTEAQTVTITADDGCKIYYSIDGSEPTTEYESALTISETTTLRAIAEDADGNKSTVTTATYTIVDPNAPGSANNPYTVAEALAFIETLGTTTSDEVYVSGIISQIDEVSTTHGNATYYISDDGTTESQLEVYRGKYLDNADFTSESQIAVGDKVTVYGKLKNYNGDTPEFNQGNYIVNLVHNGKVDIATINSLTPTEVEVGSDGTFTVDVTLAEGLTKEDYGISFTSSDENVISVDANSGEYIVGDEAGTATITVRVDALDEETYNNVEKEFTVTVTAPIDPNAPGSAENPYTVAEALAFIETLGTTTSAEVYVSGIISQIDEVSTTHGNATYYISDDGTTESQLEVYRGKYLDNADFTSESQIAVGDKVTVYGKLKNYNGDTPEFNQGNYIVNLEHSGKVDIATINTLSPTEVEVGSDGTFTVDVTLAEGLTEEDYGISFTSSDENVILVDENTGEYTVGDEPGTVTITVHVEALDNDIYNNVDKAFTVTVTDPSTADQEVIDLTGATASISFSDFSKAGSSYTTGIQGAFPASDGKAYKGWVKKDCSYQTNHHEILQMKKNAGTLTSPTIKSDKGIKVIVTYGSSAGITLQIGESSITGKAGGNYENTSSSVELSSPATETTFIISAGSNAAYISSIEIVPLTDADLAETIKVGPAGYATYVTKNAVEFNGVKAYAVTKINEKSVSLQELTSAPAHTPVIVEAEEGEYTCTIIESADAPETNLLTYSEEEFESDGTIYALANKDEVGFYPVKSGVKIPAGKAYLEVGAEVKGFLALGDMADAINNILVETANGNIFNIAGQKVQNITKGGLYIVNGKKVFVK